MFMAGKKLIGSETRLDPVLLADQSVDIRKCLATD
jgi:hypothetical protein